MAQAPTKRQSSSFESKIKDMSMDQLLDILESGTVQDLDSNHIEETRKRSKIGKATLKAFQSRPEANNKLMEQAQQYHLKNDKVATEESPSYSSQVQSMEDCETAQGKLSSDIALKIDSAFLQTLREQVESKRQLKKNTTRLVKIFRAACLVIESSQTPSVVNNSTTSNEADVTDKLNLLNRKNQNGSSAEVHLLETGFVSHNIHFVDIRAYQSSLKLCLELIPKAFDKMLGLEGLEKLDKIVMDEPKNMERWKLRSSSIKWKSLQTPMKVFFYYLRLLLETISNEGMKRYLLKVARRCTPYLLKLVKFARALIKTVISTWAQAEEESTRGMAYFTLYCWSLYDTNKYLPKILKKMQSSFKDEIAKQGNLRRLPMIVFAANSLVDLFGVDMGISYSSIFSHLRELAIVLKRVITSEGKEFRYLVENWQFVNQLRLYEMVLSSYPEKDQLRPLVYPYVQIVLGVLSISHSPNSFGLLFHCVHFLNDLMKRTNQYIPLASSVIRVLFCAELKKKPTSNEVKEKPLIWRTVLRISERQLNSRAFRDGVISQVVYLLAEYFSILSRNVAFPELIVPSVISLDNFIKETKVPKFRHIIKELKQQLEENANLIRKLRRESNCGPAQLRSQTLCSPLGFSAEEKTPMEKFFELEQERIAKEEKLLLSSVIDLEEPSTKPNSNDTISSQENDSSEQVKKNSVSGDEDVVEELVL